ncbi:MAG: hypothetical protein RIT28_1604, partial [Pseudomonadota bacterium]
FAAGEPQPRRGEHHPGAIDTHELGGAPHTSAGHDLAGESPTGGLVQKLSWIVTHGGSFARGAQTV